MKTVIALLLFICLTATAVLTVKAIELKLLSKNKPADQSTSLTASTISVKISDDNLILAVHPDHLNSATPEQKGPVYYVRIGDTISLLKDPQGYITAATRMGMETIKVVPDKSGKFYRTVSLDLKQSDEDLKKAIEVKVSDIIVK